MLQKAEYRYLMLGRVKVVRQQTQLVISIF